MSRWTRKSISSLAGIPKASPSKIAAPAQATATTSPRALKIGPPLLPGLMAASVWMSRIWSIVRVVLETIPWVTLRSMPSGLPMANTMSPTRRSSRSLITTGSGSRPLASSTSSWRIARSRSGWSAMIFTFRSSVFSKPLSVLRNNVAWIRVCFSTTW